MANQWWGLNETNVYSNCGNSVQKACCDNPTPSLANAMKGEACWVHSVDHTHWAIFDLKQMATVRAIRTACALYFPVDCGGAPWDIYFYVSTGEDLNTWTMVIGLLNGSIRKGCVWWVNDSIDAIGRYVKLEITECQWEPDHPGRDYLRWGTPECESGSGYYHHALIFDIYGEPYTPIVVELAATINTSMLSRANLLVDTLMEGSCAAVSSVIGYLHAREEMIGESVTYSSGAATLSAKQYLSGELAGYLGPFGILSDAAVKLASSAGGEIYLSGALGGIYHYLEASTAGEVHLAGEVGNILLHLTTKVIHTYSTVEGRLEGGKMLIHGFCAIYSTAIADLTVIPPPPPLHPVPIAGTVEATSFAIAYIYEWIAGTVLVNSTSVGSLSRICELRGSAISSPTVQGKLCVFYKCAGTAGATSGCSGSVINQVFIAGLVATTSGANAALSTTRELAAQVAAQSSVVGRLGIDLRGSLDATSTAIGSLSTIRELAGQSTNMSDCTGSLVGTWYLSSLVSSTGSSVGSLSVMRRLTVNVSVTSLVLGDIGVYILLAGEIAAQSTFGTSYILKVLKEIAGQLFARSRVSASWTRILSLAGLDPSTSSASATLIVITYIQGSVAANSSLNGVLSRARKMRTMVIVITSTAIGLLGVECPLTVIITCQSTVVGDLHYHLPHFVIWDVIVQPLFISTLRNLPIFEKTVENWAFLGHSANIDAYFESYICNRPVFTHGLRVDETLKQETFLS